MVSERRKRDKADSEQKDREGVCRGRREREWGQHLSKRFECCPSKNVPSLLLSCETGRRRPVHLKAAKARAWPALYSHAVTTRTPTPLRLSRHKNNNPNDRRRRRHTYTNTAQQ